MARVEKITDLIGNTPLVKINKINKGGAVVYVKLESFNPLHSAKDRIALAMIEAAEKEGKIKKESVIIEATSGNTGIGLAFVAAVKGYSVILTMPETMSLERQKLLRLLGAELELTEGAKGMKGAIARAEKLAASIPNSFMPRQFDNAANPLAHEKTSCPEIWNDTNGEIDILVAGVGTGGTITGTGRFLKSKKASVKLIAVEPSASALLSGGKSSTHRIQGIGTGFVPQVYDPKIVDEVFRCDDDKAEKTAQRLAREEGILAGISGGAAMEAALEISKRPENAGKLVVVILPDSGERYLSS